MRAIILEPGKIFGRLTVLAPSPKKWNEKTGKFGRLSYFCQCSCGSEPISVTTKNLLSGNSTSCGCISREGRTSIEPGTKFGLLTTISYTKEKWLCNCDCGQATMVASKHLTAKNGTRSCGCLTTPELVAERTRQFPPQLSSARRVWSSYKSNDKADGRIFNISFDFFLSTSQLPCFYCGSPPIKQMNRFATSKTATQFSKDNGIFIFNGMDRKQNNLGHTDENCCSCCLTCNKAKNSYSIDYFYEYINRLVINDFDLFIAAGIQLLELPTNINLLRSIKTAFKEYNDGYLTLQEYYSLSQLPCFYCSIERSNIENSNKRNPKNSQQDIAEGYFYYNGLDRVDNKIREHTLHNLVPACHQCNFAKSDLPLSDFQVWIARIKAFQSNKPL